MGIDRIAMLKYGIPDLRAFFEGDLRWLRHYGFAALDVPELAGGLSRRIAAPNASRLGKSGWVAASAQDQRTSAVQAHDQGTSATTVDHVGQPRQARSSQTRIGQQDCSPVRQLRQRTGSFPGFAQAHQRVSPERNTGLGRPFPCGGFAANRHSVGQTDRTR